MKKIPEPKVGDMVKIASGFVPAEPVIDRKFRIHQRFQGLHGLIIALLNDPKHHTAPTQDFKVLLENGATRLFYRDEIDIIGR